jgi:feruloyl-CoA hydratase/lyase
VRYLDPNIDLAQWPLLDVDEGVLSLVLNRPQQHDTISTTLDMERLLDVIREDEAVRVVVVRGSWPAQSLRLLPQPIIAMLHGACDTDTISLIESCDIVICADDATFDLPGAPHSPINAQEAQCQGLVTFSVPATELHTHTYALARELAAKDALALRFTKETLQCVPNIPWDEVLSFTSDKQAELKALQAGRPSARASAIESFLSGKTKPGTGA